MSGASNNTVISYLVMAWFELKEILGKTKQDELPNDLHANLMALLDGDMTKQEKVLSGLINYRNVTPFGGFDYKIHTIFAFALGICTIQNTMTSFARDMIKKAQMVCDSSATLTDDE